PEPFDFQLVSPERVLFSAQVEMVVVPGVEGNFGVLKGHSPLLSTVRPGVIDVYEKRTGISSRIFVAGGFAEVTNERCTVLAEEASPLSELDRAADEQLAKDLAEDLSAASDAIEKRNIEQRLAVVQERIKAAA
ncbi:MAG: ATP synthase F1 subunit epsilon, partial [Pseudomonadota bacterium]